MRKAEMPKIRFIVVSGPNVGEEGALRGGLGVEVEVGRMLCEEEGAVAGVCKYAV
jgi:hypothetical protein